MVVLTTCGTSLLTHQLGDEDRRRVTRTANQQLAKLPGEDREPLVALVARQTDLLRAADVAEARRRSAEINTLVALGGGRLPSGAYHYLVHTDTYQGQACAEALADWLGGQGHSCERHRCSGLSTASYEDFRLALGELAQWALDALPSWRGEGREVVFNLTGGFKSLQGFMQALGMVLADRSVYLFEGPGSALMTIPRLPLRMALDEAVAAHAPVLRRLALGETLPESEVADLPEVLIFPVDGQVMLSDWGQLLWAQARPELYAGELLPPAHDRLRYAEAFVAQVAKLPADRRAIVQERLDDLARHLRDPSHNPDRLSLQKLRGGPRQGSTHEAYAWSDRDARRLMLHWDDQVLVVDRLSEHLR